MTAVDTSAVKWRVGMYADDPNGDVCIVVEIFDYNPNPKPLSTGGPPWLLVEYVDNGQRCVMNHHVFMPVADRGSVR